MRDRRDFDVLLAQIDSVSREPIDHRSECRAQIRLRTMPEAQIDAAMRRAAPSLDLFQDRVAAEVARDDVFAVFRDAIALRELLAFVIQEPPAELIAEWVPHDRVHADQPR